MLGLEVEGGRTAGQRVFREAFCEGQELGTRLRKTRKQSQWAGEEVYLAQGESFTSVESNSRYRVSDAPYQEEPQDELDNPEVWAHVWMMASRMGKTRMLLNRVGYHIAEDPATSLIMYPDKEGAETWSRDTLQPSIDATPALRERVQSAKVGSGANAIAHKKYIGGHISVVGSNSPARLRQRTARFVAADEADGYRHTSGKEGDPVTLLFNRAKNYRKAIRLICSTPTIRGRSTIESWFEKSDKRFWFVKCQNKKCAEYHIPKWAYFRWDGDDRSSCRYVCPECGHEHSEAERTSGVKQGEWRPTAPFNKIRGYFLPGYVSIFPHDEAFKSKAHEFAEEVHNAKHSQNPRETQRVLVNTFFCESYQEESDLPPDWTSLFERREDYTSDAIPRGVIIITAGIDFQRDRAEIDFVGWGLNEESWGLEHTLVMGDPLGPALYSSVEAVLLKQFGRQDGAKLSLYAAGFDTGYPRSQPQLFAFLRRRLVRRWYPMAGMGQVDAEFVRPPKKSAASGIRKIMVGVNPIKALIYGRAVSEIDTPVDGNVVTPPGYMHFNQCYSAEYFKQLFVEESRSVFRCGVEYKAFEMPKTHSSTGTLRNEAIDLRVLAQAALYAAGGLRWDWGTLESRNLATIESVDPGESTPCRSKPSRARLLDGLGIDTRNWSSGWKV